MEKLPTFLKKYFWEIDFDKLDTKERSTYVIERILEYGNEEAVRWLFKNYPQKLIKSVVCQTPTLSLAGASFWALVLDIPKSKVRCLQKSYQKLQRAIWPY